VIQLQARVAITSDEARFARKNVLHQVLNSGLYE